MLAPGARLLHDCAMIFERSGDSFVLSGENKRDRAYSFGSDKSANNADGNCVADAQKKFISLFIEKNKLSFTEICETGDNRLRSFAFEMFINIDNER